MTLGRRTLPSPENCAMRRRPGMLTVVLVLLSVWGCATPVTYVPVREARFRSEVARAERIQLPLGAESRAKLMAFFRAGGDTDRIGQDLIDPEAPTRYPPLLDLLSDPKNLAMEELTEKDTYRKWFGGRAIRQVIDAREESPPAIDPIAVTDEKYWWIFYHRRKQLTELLVIKAIPRTLER